MQNHSEHWKWTLSIEKDIRTRHKERKFYEQDRRRKAGEKQEGSRREAEGKQKGGRREAGGKQKGRGGKQKQAEANREAEKQKIRGGASKTKRRKRRGIQSEGKPHRSSIRPPGRLCSLFYLRVASPSFAAGLLRASLCTPTWAAPMSKEKIWNEDILKYKTVWFFKKILYRCEIFGLQEIRCPLIGPV